MTEEKQKKKTLEKCQMCGTPKIECIDWNDYYHCCERCLNGQKR